MTDEQLAWVRAQGYENVGVVHDKFNIDHIRAERDADIADEVAAKQALTVNEAGKAGPSAAPGTVRAQRADFIREQRRPLHLDRGEHDAARRSRARTRPRARAARTPARLLHGRRVRRRQQLHRPAAPDDYIDPDRQPLTTTSTTHPIFRIGNKGDGARGARLREGRGPERRRRHDAAKEWLPKNPPGYAANFRSNFNTRYYMAQEGYERVQALAAEYPNIAKEVKAPEQTWGYMSKAATMVGYQRPPT